MMQNNMKRVGIFLLGLCIIILVYFIFLTLKVSNSDFKDYDSQTLLNLKNKGISRQDVEQLPYSLVKYISTNDSLITLVDQEKEYTNNLEVGNLIFRAEDYSNKHTFYLITYFERDNNYLPVNTESIVISWNHKDFTRISSFIHVDGYNYLGIKKSTNNGMLDFYQNQNIGFNLSKLFKYDGFCWTKVYKWNDENAKTKFESTYNYKNQAIKVSTQ